jgi:hypothetical protein
MFDLKIILIFVIIYLAMISSAFWESYSEGREAWGMGKFGFKTKVFGFEISGYHIFLFLVTWPLLLILPFAIFGWNSYYFGVVMSAFFSGLIVEDFFWYIVNPEVRVYEFWMDFSNYYPWLKIKGRKIVPIGYLIWLVLALVFWYFFWR